MSKLEWNTGRAEMLLHPGEGEARGWQVAKLDDVVGRLFEASPAVHGRPRVIAIDGRGGAGKSMLAERLRGHVPGSAVVHTDDIAWNHAMFDWGSALADNVLRPLHRGAEIKFRPPAWIERGRPGVIHVPAGVDVVWVEGTGIIRQELAQWIDVGIYVQGDLAEQERRLVARDGNSPEMQQHKAEWLREELPFMLQERPWEQAALVVAGTAALDHSPDVDVVVSYRLGAAGSGHSH
jgi:hypothetical protein